MTTGQILTTDQALVPTVIANGARALAGRETDRRGAPSESDGGVTLLAALCRRALAIAAPARARFNLSARRRPPLPPFRDPAHRRAPLSSVAERAGKRFTPAAHRSTIQTIETPAARLLSRLGKGADGGVRHTPRRHAATRQSLAETLERV